MAEIHPRKILDVLRNDEQQIIIPIYQRNYDWAEENCVKLIKDVWSFREILEVDPNSAYFIGSMIYKKIDNKNEVLNKISLVDGQQRITTFLLLIKALSILDGNINHKKYVFSDYGNEATKMKIARVKSEKMLEKIFKIESYDEVSQLNSEDKYVKNFAAMVKYIKNEEIDVVHLFKILGNVELAWVLLRPSEDENKIFETINSTGKPLTNADLIKNFILSKVHNMTKENEDDLIDLYSNKIENIFEKEKFDKNDFFRYFNAIYWQVKLENSKGRSVYFQFKKCIKESGIDINDFESVEVILKDVLKSALIYYRAKAIKEIQVEDIKTSKYKYFKMILNENFALFPIYSKLMWEWTELVGDQLKNKKDNITEYEILFLIAKYYLYRNITNRLDKNITRDVVTFFDKFKEQGEEVTLEKFEAFLMQRNSDDQKLPYINEVIKDIKYVTYAKRKLVKWILYASEIGGAHTMHSSIFEYKKLEIEHIFPQNTPKWFTEFQNENRLEEFHEFEMEKHNIANLTLASKANNIHISDNVFSFKKNALVEDVPIRMNSILRDYDKYSREMLNERMKHIITNFFKTFNEEINSNVLDNINQYKSQLSQPEEFEKEAERTSVTKKSNFGWVKNKDKELYNVLERVEDDIYNMDESRYQDAEVTLRRVVENTFIDANEKTTLFEKLQELEEQQKIDEDILSIAHDIRKKANESTHVAYNKVTSRTRVMYMFEGVHKILSDKHGNESTFVPEIYFRTDIPEYKYSKPQVKIKKRTKRESSDSWLELEEFRKYINMTERKEEIGKMESDIFKYLNRIDSATKAYDAGKVEIFSKDCAKKSLFMYLYEKIGGGTVDSVLTGDRRNRGWLSQATLAYFSMDTNGSNRGVLKERGLSSDESLKLISDLVDKYY